MCKHGGTFPNSLVLLCESGFEPNFQIWNPMNFSGPRPILGLGSSQNIASTEHKFEHSQGQLEIQRGRFVHNPVTVCTHKGHISANMNICPLDHHEDVFRASLKTPCRKCFWHMSSVLESVISLLVRALCGLSNPAQKRTCPLSSAPCACVPTLPCHSSWHQVPGAHSALLHREQLVYYRLKRYCLLDGDCSGEISTNYQLYPDQPERFMCPF